MRYSTFDRLYNEAKEYTSVNRYIAERGWQPWMSSFNDGDLGNVLTYIYEVAHEGFTAAEKAYTYPTVKRISEMFDVAYQTVQRWHTGVATPSESTLRLLCFAAVSDMEIDPESEE